MIFPCMEFILVIFQVFYDFQSLWEPCPICIYTWKCSKLWLCLMLCFAPQPGSDFENYSAFISLEIFSCFFVILFQIIVSGIGVSDSLYPDQATHFVITFNSLYAEKCFMHFFFQNYSFRNTISFKQFRTRSGQTFCFI